MSWHRTTGRSDLIAKDGMVATSQPLATQAGIEILRKGGNAVDAAVASAAVLDVVEPFSTGCGGDAFALIHLPGKNRPISINGSGRSGSIVTLDDLLEKGWTEMPLRGGPPVTVPGAMHMWYHVIEKYGNLEFKEVLAPAIHYARNGFPVSPMVSRVWSIAVSILINDYAKKLFSIDGRGPRIGETMKNKDQPEEAPAATSSDVKSSLSSPQLMNSRIISASYSPNFSGGYTAFDLPTNSRNHCRIRSP